MSQDVNPAASILVVEDSPDMGIVFQQMLAEAGYRASVAETWHSASEELDRSRYDLVLLDILLPDTNGLDVLKHIGRARGAPSVIVITGHATVRTAVAAMHDGAEDYLMKPVSKQRLLDAVASALRHRGVMPADPGPAADGASLGFIGQSPPIRRIVRMLDRIALSQAPVFVSGESGTGKELCASAIHRLGPRASQPFVAINCAAIPRELMESEIFGHVRGAFTGAHADRLGAACQANGGTLFLDEIGEMDVGLQSKLLRFVQTGTFRRVGGSRLESVDVRFVCATNRDPDRLISEGRFREDLFYRLHVIPIDVPPLRERGDDILLLARHFLASYAREEGRPIERLSPAAEAAILAYPWPGNVRELQNVIRRLVVMQDGPVVTREMLPAQIADADGRSSATAATGLPPLEGRAGILPLHEVERAAIENALAACGGNVSQAAALLEINPSTIYRKQAAWRRAERRGRRHASAEHRLDVTG